MKTYTATYAYHGAGTSVFLAGGITGCPNWQAELRDLLAHEEITLLNPRRDDFPINDPLAAPLQIRWEYEHLRRATAILFWFPFESICPIALFELGAWLGSPKKLFIGAHPNYSRRLDITNQTFCARPEQVVYGDLPALARGVSQWLNDGV